jgi:hypothetical protein
MTSIKIYELQPNEIELFNTSEDYIHDLADIDLNKNNGRNMLLYHAIYFAIAYNCVVDFINYPD